MNESTSLDSPDRIDQMFQAYLRRQVPKSFPPPLLESAEASLPRKRSLLARSRWATALCLSVVIVALGLLLAASSTSRPRPTISPEDVTASPRKAYPSPAVAPPSKSRQP